MKQRGLESQWPLGKKVLACVLALAIGMGVPLPRQDEALAETLAPAQIGQLDEDEGQGAAGEQVAVESAEELQEGIRALEGDDEEDPDLSEKYISNGVYEDRIGIKWVYQVRKNGTANISGRQNSPDIDGENWVIPDTVVDEMGSHTVTSMVGSTMGPGNWFFNGGNANSITFPATIKRMADTWGQSFLTSLCFSGYDNADGRVFFLGHAPEDLNWERDISSSDLKMTIYTPYPEEWAKNVPTYWGKTKFAEYIPPTGFYAAVQRDDGLHKIGPDDVVEIPVGDGELIHVVTEPALEAGGFYKWHSNVKWESDYDNVSVYGQSGWVWALRAAHPGDTATIKMENGLYQTYQFKVKVVEEVADPVVTDSNGVSWRFRENDDGIPGDPQAKTATLTELVNKKSYAGRDLIVPSRIADKGVEYVVTKVAGMDFYSSDEAMFEGVEARSVTFPATIRAIDDQSTRFFYNMIEQGGKIFFLGAPPAIDWDNITGDRGPSGLVVRSVQEWKDAGCPWIGDYAFTMDEYDGPEGLEVQRDGRPVTDKVVVPVGSALKLDAVSVPADDNYYAAHVAVRWSSSNGAVNVADDGTVTAAASAQAGTTATLTAVSALGYEATCEVEFSAVPEKVDIADCTVSLSDGFEVYKPTMNSVPYFPSFTVRDGEKTLVADEDFEVAYKEPGDDSAVAFEDLAAGGKYNMVISGKGLYYKGSRSIGFFVVSGRVPVAGWKYSVENVGGSKAIVIDRYVGAESGTVVVPAFIGENRVTKIAAGAFDGVNASALVVPDSVSEMGDLSGASVKTVRFMGAAPKGFSASALPAGASVERFAAHAGSFAGVGGSEPSVPWKYYLKLSLYGNSTGVLGSAAESPTSGCQKASDAAADFSLPSAIDGVSLSVIGERAVASDAGDDGLLDFSVVRVPACYAEIQGGVFNHLNAVVVFEGTAPQKTGLDAISLGDRSNGMPNPEVLYPRGAAGWDKAAASFGDGNWASANSRGDYDTRYAFSFIDNEDGPGKDAYITGYNGTARGVWKYPTTGDLSQESCTIGYQVLGGFKDSHIDASRLTQISVPGGVDQIIGNAFENIDPDKCDEVYFSTLVHQKVPTATDYAHAFTVKEGADKSRISITCPASNYQAWRNSEWGKYYNIKIHMVSAPSLFDYEEVTLSDADGNRETGLAVVGYHGIENSVALPRYVDGVVKDGVRYEGPVIAVGESAFDNSSVVAVNVPGSVISVGPYAFRNSAVSYVNLEEGIERVGTWCFWGCSALREITLPASLVDMGEAPFGVSGLENVYVNNGGRGFADIDGVLFSADKKKLVYYPLKRSDSTYQVPAGTEVIGKFAFRGAADMYVDPYSISNIVLPSGLKTIEDYAFQQLDELYEITLPDSVTRLGRYAFSSCSSLHAMNIPAGVTTVPEGFLEFCTSVTEVTVPAGVKSIDEDAFLNMDELETVSLPEGLETIGYRAFGSCVRLSNITFPRSLKRIEESAFVADTEIRTFGGDASTFGLEKTSLEYLGSGAFAGLVNVKGTLVIPATMKEMANAPFASMHSIKKVEFADGFAMTELGDLVFANMSGLEWITIPAQITKVGAGLFYETSVQRTDADSKLHVIFQNQGEWECDEDQSTFSNRYDTILQAYVYGYETSSTKANISDSDGNVFSGIVWKPIDIEVSSEWEDTTYVEPGKQFKLVVDARSANGDLSYAWRVDGELVEGMTSETFTYTFNEKARHLVSVDVTNSFDPENPKTIATTVDVADPGDIKYSLTRAKVDAIPVQMWTGGQVKPKPRVTYEGAVLAEGKDYTLSYSDNAGVGTGKVFIEGAGRYLNIISATFAIVGATQSALMDAIASAKVARYDVVVSDDGFGLAAGTWYAPSAQASALDAAIKEATAVALATNPAKTTIAAAAKKLQEAQSAFVTAKLRATGEEKPGVQAATVSIADQVYSGEAVTPSFVVKRAGKTLAQGVDYKASFANNSSVGRARLTIQGIGSYAGSKTVTFNVNPAGTTVSKVSAAKGKGSLNVKWEKQSVQTSGYEIMVATNAKFTANLKVVKVANANKASTLVKGLKSKKKHYVKVRTFKTVGAETFYSNWSPVKRARTK